MTQPYILVDTTSYLYRAYHAMPMLTNSANEPTGAIYGVLSMIRRLETEYNTDHIICVFDGKERTFRHEQYTAYKANRPPIPDDLVVQIEPLHQIIKAMGWPIIVAKRVEADDVIGTLAKEIVVKEGRCLISTGDKDMAQLVNEHVCLINTMKNEYLDPEGVVQKFGIRPDQMVDYLSLIGDSSDNVPGVAKVGPKTAVKWLNQYGSLDGIVKNADSIGGAVGENLRAALDWLPQARALLTIKTDVMDLPSLETLVRCNPDWDTLRTLYDRFEFKTWRRELPSANEDSGSFVPESMPSTEKAAYRVINTVDELEAWIERLMKADKVAVDTETTSLDAMRAEMVGISWAVDDKEAVYLPFGHRAMNAPEQLDRDFVLGKLKGWLESDQHKKIGQNIKYDMHIFENHGIRLKGVWDDTMIESYLLTSHLPCGLDAMAVRYLHRENITYEDVCGKGAKKIPFCEADFDLAARYAAEDAEVTFKLQACLEEELSTEEALTKIYRDIEIPIISILQKMERKGVLINVFALQAQSEILTDKMHTLEAEAYDAAGQTFNVNSTKQLREILFDKLRIPPVKKTPGGVPSVDDAVLEKLADDHPLPRILRDYRSIAKLKSTYIDKLPQMIHPSTGRIHTTYSQTVAVTGRLASSEPNLQNIPIRTAEGRRIREAFIASPGTQLVSADYSQIELRIMAHLSEDENLLSAFASGKDIHQATAAEVFNQPLEKVTPEQRRFAKAINFGLIYGMSAFGLSRQISVDVSSAANYMERYFTRYPKVREYMERTRQIAYDQGYVETLFGRKVWAPNIRSSKGPLRQAAERAAINAPMQGTAADLIKLAMIKVDEWLTSEKMETQMIMQVHDELIFEVPLAEMDKLKEALPKLMGSVGDLRVPLEVEVGMGDNWDQAH